jgi:hypothetical protein
VVAAEGVARDAAALAVGIAGNCKSSSTEGAPGRGRPFFF